MLKIKKSRIFILSLIIFFLSFALFGVYQLVSINAVTNFFASTQIYLNDFHMLSKGNLYLFTADQNERRIATTLHGFRETQNIIGKISTNMQTGTIPLYRFNTGSGYFYTGSEQEAVAVSAYGWKKEGIAGYIFPIEAEGTVPLYRLRKNELWTLSSDKNLTQRFILNGYSNDGPIGYIYTSLYTPTPTSPNLGISPQLGAFFFYWFNCPHPTYQCDRSKMPFIPTNYSSYSADNVSWYRKEFTDMKSAGIDIIIAVSWGNRHPSLPTLKDNRAIPLMVQALKDNKSTQKIAFLDDTNSVVAEWNIDKGNGYSNPTENPSIPKMPLSDDKNWSYFYDRKIKPFYTLLPKQYWATHNGKSVESGGRPLILIYDAARSFSHLEYSDEMWFAIKNQFLREFNVDPYLVLDYSWFDYNSEKIQLEKVADGKFVWAGGNDSVDKIHTLNGFTTASIDPGLICPSWNIYVGCKSKDRSTNPQTGQRSNGERLRSLFSQSSQSNLILLETWNELNEASGVGESNGYTDINGQSLPSRFYIDLLNTLKKQYIP